MLDRADEPPRPQPAQRTAPVAHTCTRDAGDRLDRRPHAHRHRLEHLDLARREPVMRSPGPRGGDEVLPRRPDQLEHLGPFVTRRAPLADPLVDALGGRARHRPGHAHHSGLSGRPSGGVERAAAERGLDEHGARVSAAISRLRDRNRTWSGAEPGGASETTAYRPRCAR